jgi:hypothetical protein
MKNEKAAGKRNEETQVRNSASETAENSKRLQYQSVQKGFSAAISSLNLATALLIFSLLAFTLAIPSAFAVQDLMSLQGNADDNGAPINNGNLTVTIWDSAAGGNLIYNSSSDFAGAINSGRFDVILGSGTVNLSLVYGRIYYMDMIINNQDLTFNGSARRMFESSVGNITSTVIPPQTINATHIVNGAITDTQIGNSASINKTKIGTLGTWLEADIPSLTSTWAGTLNATRIVSALLLNVNNSQFLGGISAASYLANDSTLSGQIAAVNSSSLSISSLNANSTALTGFIDVNSTSLTGKINAVNSTGGSGSILAVNNSLNSNSTEFINRINAVNSSSLSISSLNSNSTALTGFIDSNSTALTGKINAVNSSSINVASLNAVNSTLNSNSTIFVTITNGLNASIAANSTSFTNRIIGLNTSIDSNSTSFVGSIGALNNSKADQSGTYIGLSVGSAVNATNASMANNSLNLNGMNGSYYLNVSNILSGLLNASFLDSAVALVNGLNVFRRVNEFQNSTYLATVEGNVGIGTTAPLQKLTVNGTINVTNVTLAQNCAEGQVLEWNNGVGYCSDPTREFDNVTIGHVIVFNLSVNPPIPSGGQGYLYVKNVSGRALTKFTGPSGVDYPLQPSFFQNNIGMISAGSAAALNSVGTGVTSVGTITHPIPTERYGYMANFATAAGAGSTGGTGDVVTRWMRGTSVNGSNGFFFNARLAYTNVSYNQTRTFVGFTSGTMANSVSADDPAGSFVGFQWVNNSGGGRIDVNWSVMTKDGATQYLFNTSVPFNTTGVYDFFLYCKPLCTEVSWRIDDLISGQTQEGVISTYLPATNTYLRSGFQINNVAAVPRSIRMQRVYTESDR